MLVSKIVGICLGKWLGKVKKEHANECQSEKAKDERGVMFRGKGKVKIKHAFIYESCNANKLY
jgi:hypothetical protein